MPTAVTDASPLRNRLRVRVPVQLLLVAGPALFLLATFVLPTAFHLTVSFFISDAGLVVTDRITLDNYIDFFARPFFRDVLLRSFLIGGAVGLLVVVLAFPLSYFLVRTTSRWKNELVALCFAPLLASVIVRTYGWHTILHRDGIVNEALLWIGVISEPLLLTPSTGAIIVGLTHVLLPYGVLTIMSSLQGINPNLESAAMNLGASRFKTFFRVVLPLSIPGVAGGFFLAFAITLSAYATPAILGGPRQETMATMIYAFMNDMLDWSMSSTIGMILVITAMALMFMAAAFGNRRGAL